MQNILSLLALLRREALLGGHLLHGHVAGLVVLGAALGLDHGPHLRHLHVIALGLRDILAERALKFV